jgi:regulator of protease activity HflC (stomatin/prohibitin superfamily)
MFPILDLLIVGLVVIALSGLRVAQEYERGVVFRLGRYKGLRGPGLYWIIPLNIERAVRVDIRTRTVSAEQQVIPSDFVSLAHSLNDYLQRQASSRSVTDNNS